MPLWQFEACCLGYRSRLCEQAALSVIAGYYSGYYSNAKRPKSPSKIIERIMHSGDYSTAVVATEHKDYDMEAEIALFEKRSALFRSRGVYV